jgi:hypothetical protein
MLNQNIYFWPFWPLIMTHGHSIIRTMPDPESTHVTDQNEGSHDHIILNWKMSSIWGHPIFDPLLDRTIRPSIFHSWVYIVSYVQVTSPNIQPMFPTSEKFIQTTTWPWPLTWPLWSVNQPANVSCSMYHIIWSHYHVKLETCFSTCFDLFDLCYWPLVIKSWNVYKNVEVLSSLIKMRGHMTMFYQIWWMTYFWGHPISDPWLARSMGPSIFYSGLNLVSCV